MRRAARRHVHACRIVPAMGSVDISSASRFEAGQPAHSTSVLSLENGDRLTRAEFERRYEARPDLKQAELVEGVVYVPSPTRSGSHARPHATLVGWLFAYVASTPGVQLNDNPTLRLDLDNEPQPDVALLIDRTPAAGARQRRRLHRRRTRAGRRDRRKQRVVRSARQAARLPAQRRARVPGLAHTGSRVRLVRAGRRRLQAAAPGRVRDWCTARRSPGSAWRWTPCCGAIFPRSWSAATRPGRAGSRSVREAPAGAAGVTRLFPSTSACVAERRGAGSQSSAGANAGRTAASRGQPEILDATGRKRPILRGIPRSQSDDLPGRPLVRAPSGSAEEGGRMSGCHASFRWGASSSWRRRSP